MRARAAQGVSILRAGASTRTRKCTKALVSRAHRSRDRGLVGLLWHVLLCVSVWMRLEAGARVRMRPAE